MNYTLEDVLPKAPQPQNPLEIALLQALRASQGASAPAVADNPPPPRTLPGRVNTPQLTPEQMESMILDLLKQGRDPR